MFVINAHTLLEKLKKQGKSCGRIRKIILIIIYFKEMFEIKITPNQILRFVAKTASGYTGNTHEIRYFK